MTASAATPAGPAVHTDLPASLRAPRQARQTIRTVLRSWGLTALSDSAELCASELVANASEHSGGGPIGLTIRRHTEPGGEHGILCQVTDTAPAIPEPRPAEPGSERGRGLQVVAALATTSGFTRTPAGKMAWFTLATADPGPDRQPERQAEAGR